MAHQAAFHLKKSPVRHVSKPLEFVYEEDLGLRFSLGRSPLELNLMPPEEACWSKHQAHKSRKRRRPGGLY
jgi:hypothetical protein